jgi:ubiquinone/menaquinone biosynthesis C-methylase UbiE
MAQIKNGMRKILENPLIYTAFQNLLGARKLRRILVEMMDLKDGMNILDVGCGPGDVVQFLNCNINYYGFDFQKNYIESAIQKYGTKGNYNFIHSDIKEFDFQNIQFDRIIISGVLHHLDDEEIELLFSKIGPLLTKKGKLLCLETCFIKNQEFIARKLAEFDRGKNVRFVEGYLNLMKKFFKKINFDIRKDLLRVPYTLVFLKCSNDD